MATHAELSGEPYLRTKADELRRTVVAPAPDEPHAPGKNILYCAIIQLAWNELMGLCNGPVAFTEPCAIADRLNQAAPTFTRHDLDEESCVARAGEGEVVLKQIRRELERKFEGAASPGLLSASLPPDSLLVHAYLFKNLAFATPLLRNEGDGLAFDGQEVSHFGLWTTLGETPGWKEQAKQVLIHDYRSETDFVVELLTKAGDDSLIIARIPPGPTLRATAEQALGRAEPSLWSRVTGGTRLRTQDKLKVPILDFDILRRYVELVGKQLAEGRVIAEADQSIRFRLDDKGALLKAEFSIGAPRGGFNPGFMPRELVCDGPFLVLLLRKGRRAPYFALWIDNTELLVPAREAPPPPFTRP